MSPIEESFSAEDLAVFSEQGTPYDGAAATDAPADEVNEPTEHTDRPAEQLDVYRDPATGKFTPAPQASPVTAPVAEPEPAAATATPAAAQAAPAPTAEQPAQMVPLQALHEARARGATTARENAMLRTRLQSMLDVVNQRQEAPALDLENAPRAGIEAIDARLRQIEAGQGQPAQTENPMEAIDQALIQDEAAFELSTPDYGDASKFYVQRRGAELQVFYQPHEVQQILLDEVRSITQHAWQRNMSPAEVIYKLAQAGGYQRAPLQAPAPTPAAALPAPAPQAPTPAALVASVQAGQAATRTMSGATGAAQPTLDMEAVLGMNDEEFMRAIGYGNNAATARFAKMMGE